jgi:hypothetical protein
MCTRWLAAAAYCALAAASLAASRSSLEACSSTGSTRGRPACRSHTSHRCHFRAHPALTGQVNSRLPHPPAGAEPGLPSHPESYWSPNPSQQQPHNLAPTLQASRRAGQRQYHHPAQHTTPPTRPPARPTRPTHPTPLKLCTHLQALRQLFHHHRLALGAAVQGDWALRYTRAVQSHQTSGLGCGLRVDTAGTQAFLFSRGLVQEDGPSRRQEGPSWHWRWQPATHPLPAV